MNIAEYVNALIKSVICDGMPPEKPGEFSFEDVFTFAANHKLENICYAGIKRLKTQPDEGILK